MTAHVLSKTVLCVGMTTTDGIYIDGERVVVPAGIGINWSSSLEVAYRVMSWSWILLLLRNSAALSGRRLQTVLQCDSQCALEVIERGEPALILAHWTGFYWNGEERGFAVAGE